MSKIIKNSLGRHGRNTRIAFYFNYSHIHNEKKTNIFGIIEFFPLKIGHNEKWTFDQYNHHLEPSTYLHACNQIKKMIYNDVQFKVESERALILAIKRN